MTSSFMSKFRLEMEKLGAHPDKNIITTLTVSADRHRHRAPEIVDLIARAVLSSRIPPANRLPLCYLMDSVLKNVGEPYIGMFGAHVAAMACRTYEHGTVRDRQCVLKLLRTWKERALFSHSTVSNIDSFIDRLEKGAYIPQERRPDERRTPPLPPPPHEPMSPHDPLPPHEPIYGGGASSRQRAGVDGRRDGRDRRIRDVGRERRERRDGRERDFYPPELPNDAPPRLPPVQLPSRASQSRPGENDRRPPPPPSHGHPGGSGPSVYDPPAPSVYDPPPLEPEVGDKRRPPDYTGGGGSDPRQAKRPQHSAYSGRDRQPPPPGPPPPPPPPPRHDPYLPPEPLPPPAPPALRPPPPPMPSQPQLPAPPPPPPPLFTLPPVAKDIHFVIAVEKEMRTMLQAMVTELGEKPMSIEELAKRSPQTAEDFKKAAEAAIAYRIQMAAIEAEKAKGPFQEPLSGPTDYDAAREVVNRIKRRLLELQASPTQLASTRAGLLTAAAQSAAQLEAMIQTMEASATLLATPKPAALSAADQLMTKAALQAFAQQMVLQQQQQQQPAAQPTTPSGAQHLLSSLLGLVPAAPATQQLESSSGLGPFTSESVSKKIPWVIHALHQGDQCPEDGRRFTSKEQLQEHLDWHFRKNEKARETGGKRDKAIKSRPWLLAVSAWVAQPRPAQLILMNGEKAKAVASTSDAKGNGVAASQQSQMQAVPADASYPDCRLCGEPFAQFWDEGAQMFMYSGVVRVLVGDGRLLRVDPGMEVPPGSRLIPVHQLCFQAAPSQEAVTLLQARRSTSIGVTPMVEG